MPTTYLKWVKLNQTKTSIDSYGWPTPPDSNKTAMRIWPYKWWIQVINLKNHALANKNGWKVLLILRRWWKSDVHFLCWEISHARGSGFSNDGGGWFLKFDSISSMCRPVPSASAKEWILPDNPVHWVWCSMIRLLIQLLEIQLVDTNNRTLIDKNKVITR